MKFIGTLLILSLFSFSSSADQETSQDRTPKELPIGVYSFYLAGPPEAVNRYGDETDVKCEGETMAEIEHLRIDRIVTQGNIVFEIYQFDDISHSFIFRGACHSVRFHFTNKHVHSNNYDQFLKDVKNSKYYKGPQY